MSLSLYCPCVSLQVACMQFINIVVHSVENMNFRVHLQFEFTYLGLDKYLGVSNNDILGVSEHSMGSIDQLTGRPFPEEMGQ